MGYDIARGIFAGAAATLAMSALMLAGRAAGLMGTMPPERITSRLLDLAGVRRGRRAQDATAGAFHLAFGTAGGGLFGAAAGRAGLRRRSLLVAAGIAYGTAIWLVSYRGWVPALGAMPPADRDRPGRPQTMLAAHWVYGAVLGLLAAPRR